MNIEIKNGRIIDPKNGVDRSASLFVVDGKIAGLGEAPAGFVAAAIARAELEDLDTEIAAPPRMMPYLQQAMARMGEVSFDEYYSLCGRLDTLEHLHEVLVAVAAQMLGTAADSDEGDEGDDGPAELDEPGGPVN